MFTDGDGLPGYSSDYRPLEGNDTDTPSNSTGSENSTSTADLRTLIDGASTEGTVTGVSSSSTLTVEIDGTETVVHAASVTTPDVTANTSTERRTCLETVRADGQDAVDERYNGESVVVWPAAGESVGDGEVSAYVYLAEQESAASMSGFLLENGFGVIDSSTRPDGVSGDAWRDMQDSHRSSMSVADGLNRGLWAC